MLLCLSFVNVLEKPIALKMHIQIVQKAENRIYESNHTPIRKRKGLQPLPNFNSLAFLLKVNGFCVCYDLDLKMCSLLNLK